MKDPHILVVDDDESILALFRDIGERRDNRVTVACNGTELRAALDTGPADIVFLDLNLPGEDGIKLLQVLADWAFDGSVVLISGSDNRVLSAARRIAENAGFKSVSILEKPFMLKSVHALIDAVPESSRRLSADEAAFGLANGQFVLFYQPKVSLRGNDGWQVCAVEALSRWIHPQRGLVSPAAFLPLLEQHGLMANLTARVINLAALQGQAWQRAGMPLQIALNISAACSSDRTLPDRIAEILGKTGFASERLVLEITESGVMSDPAASIEALTRLRVRGVSLSIDDFGTGFSSLVQLYRMPFSEIKIDRSFVSEMGRDREATIIVRAIIELAHNMGLTCCAEGVETIETDQMLRAMDCDTAQGYLYARPLPPDELRQMLRDGSALTCGPGAP